PVNYGTKFVRRCSQTSVPQTQDHSDQPEDSASLTPIWVTTGTRTTSGSRTSLIYLNKGWYNHIMSNFVTFRHVSNGQVRDYPEHYENHPVLGADLERYDAAEYEEDKVVI